MKLLIKLGIIIGTLLGSMISSAQSPSNKIYNQFSGKEGVSSVDLSQSALTPFEIFLTDDTKEVIAKIDRCRFMNYDENKGRLRTYQVFDRISDALNSSNYFSIDPSEVNCHDCPNNWNSNDVKLWGRGDRSAMNEFHILAIDNNNCVLFSFYGKMTIDDINSCAQLSNTANIKINIE